MRNSALNEKMRVVDLGVAVCIDAIIRNAEALQNDTITSEQASQYKAQIRKNAQTYKQAIDELLGVLDDDKQPQTANKPANFADFSQNLTRCTACGIADKETDDAMQQLAIVTEAAISIPFIIQQLIETVGNQQKLETTLYDFSEMATVYLQHVITQREALQQVLILKEQGGSDE